MDNFCIIVNQDRDEQLELTRRVEEFLVGQGKQYCIRMEASLDASKTDLELPEATECVIVLGGDGTMIRAANRLLHYDIPLFGINAGTLGYLTGVEAVDAEYGLERICNNEFRIEQRMLLDVWYNGTYMDTVLNEAAITRSGLSCLIRAAVYVNGALLDDISGDGLLIATPTGSTGYNLSAGGAVVKPEAQLIMITPICPHSLTSRGVIVASSDEIAIEIVAGRRNKEVEAVMTFDGREAIKLAAGDRITIRKSKAVTKMIQLEERTFFEILRSKLGSVEH